MDIYSLGVFFSYSIRLLILGVQQECACLSSFTKPSYCLSLFIQKKKNLHASLVGLDVGSQVCLYALLNAKKDINKNLKQVNPKIETTLPTTASHPHEQSKNPTKPSNLNAFLFEPQMLLGSKAFYADRFSHKDLYTSTLFTKRRDISFVNESPQLQIKHNHMIQPLVFAMLKENKKIPVMGMGTYTVFFIPKKETTSPSAYSLCKRPHTRTDSISLNNCLPKMTEISSQNAQTQPLMSQCQPFSQMILQINSEGHQNG